MLLGKKIEIPDYNEEQKELWIDRDCPSYTGIMAAVNQIAFRRFGCFIDNLTQEKKDVCFKEAASIGMAWFEMPD